MESSAHSQDCWSFGPADCNRQRQAPASAVEEFKNATFNINAACCQARSNSDGNQLTLDTSDERRPPPATSSSQRKQLGANLEFQGENRSDTEEIANSQATNSTSSVLRLPKFAVDFNQPGGSPQGNHPSGTSTSVDTNALHKDQESPDMPEATTKDDKETEIEERGSETDEIRQSRSQWEIVPSKAAEASFPNPQAQADEVGRLKTLRDLVTRSPDTPGTTTKEGHETENEEGDRYGSHTAESSSSGGILESEELQTEMEGQSISFPDRTMVGKGIWAPPLRTRKPRPTLVFGQIGILVSEVSEEAIAIPLRSPALKDMLENRERYRAIAMRCGCELVFTRRVVVKRVVKWLRYVILLLRGPSDVALRRFRARLDAANPTFRSAVAYDAEKPRPRLLTSENLPDNLELGVAKERLGRAASGWELMPLAMPQRKYGKPNAGKNISMLLPNNGCIGPVLSYVYPQWGFQCSKPIPQEATFATAVKAAEVLEKQQKTELQEGK